MTCNKCGNILADYMKFCTKCGMAITPANSSVTPQALINNPASVATQSAPSLANSDPQPMASGVAPAPVDPAPVYPNNMVSPMPTNPAPAVSSPVPQVEVSPWLEFKRIYLVLMAVVVGLSLITVLGALATGTLTSSEPPSFMFAFRSGLMLFGVFSVASILYGIILCTVFVLLGKKPTSHQLYYKRNALWTILGPILLFVVVVVCFVIGNVISRFVAS